LIFGDVSTLYFREQLAYLRRNGKFFLEITGHPRFGLPYGQDRLIPIWIATLALRQKGRAVRFRSAAQMLEFFHLTKDGRHYRRIVEGFQRVFAATTFFGTDDQPGRNQMTDCTRFHFFESMHLWFSDADPVGQNGSSENTITLSDAFFRKCNEHRIPVEREVVAALANAPGLLDFYVWLVWKSWSLRERMARIPLLGPGGLTEQLGNAPYAVERTFRLTISRWLRAVTALWPQCPANLSEDRRALIVRSSQTASAIRRRSCQKAFVSAK
jgi:Plasmid encoded RepA protein